MVIAKAFEHEIGEQSFLRRVGWGEDIAEAVDACKLPIPPEKRKDVIRGGSTYFDADGVSYWVYVTSDDDRCDHVVLRAIESWHEIVVRGGHKITAYQSDFLIDAGDIVRYEGRPCLLGIREMGTEFYSYDWWNKITDLEYVREKADAFEDIFWYRWDGKALLPITEADLGERIEFQGDDESKLH